MFSPTDYSSFIQASSSIVAIFVAVFLGHYQQKKSLRLVNDESNKRALLILESVHAIAHHASYIFHEFHCNLEEYIKHESGDVFYDASAVSLLLEDMSRIPLHEAPNGIGVTRILNVRSEMQCCIDKMDQISSSNIISDIAVTEGFVFRPDYLGDMKITLNSFGHHLAELYKYTNEFKIKNKI